MYICPYFDPSTKKCKLWDTYQSDYIVCTYCQASYSDQYKKCENYIKKH